MRHDHGPPAGKNLEGANKMNGMSTINPVLVAAGDLNQSRKAGSTAWGSVT